MKHEQSLESALRENAARRKGKEPQRNIDVFIEKAKKFAGEFGKFGNVKEAPIHTLLRMLKPKPKEEVRVGVRG